MHNPHKTISANANGIIITFRDKNKHQYVPYEGSKYVKVVQTEEDNKYQQALESPVFNKIQQKLYAQVLYGLEVYKPDELEKLSPKERNQITATYKRVQFFLNKWKQEIVDEQCNRILSMLFPKSQIIKKICSVNGYNRAYKDRHTFRELGLTQESIAKKLVEAGFLPENFFQLT